MLIDIHHRPLLQTCWLQDPTGVDMLASLQFIFDSLCKGKISPAAAMVVARIPLQECGKAAALVATDSKVEAALIALMVLRVLPR